MDSTFLHISPEEALRFSAPDTLRNYYERLGGQTMQTATNPLATVPSPVAGEPDGQWLKRCHMVGVNIRTIGSFFDLLKYALTLPDHIRGIHLLPIWEPGVVGSLYGMASWRVNTEFYSPDMARMIPGAASVEAQLKIVINLLHALGKVVGMDVIPHTDRFSEMVIEHPEYFEWLRREDTEITDHRENLHEDAAAIIASVGKHDRIKAMDALIAEGYEPVPATMAPPYRGIEVDTDSKIVDADGRVWRDYRITEPTEMSRVFGPLARYKFWGRKEDNQHWQIDFDNPRHEVWYYFTEQYDRIQERYGFDFMRGDMSHVQMRPEGVPEEITESYDPLRATKRRIGLRAPYFAYFAESFLAPPGYMAYGDEVEHLVASQAEVTLGNLQSLVPGSEEFCSELSRYLDIAGSTSLTPSFTAITGDKDDPRFDHFHHHGEVARMFFGLFNGALPLYYSLGFEQRNRHFEPAPNEVYTKLYVFQEGPGPKYTEGPWQWGKNLEQFEAFRNLHQFAEGLLSHLGADAGAGPPSPRGGRPAVFSWLRPDTYGDGAYLFVVNFSDAEVDETIVANPTDFRQADLLYAWPAATHHQLGAETGEVLVPNLGGGVARCYRLR